MANVFSMADTYGRGLADKNRNALIQQQTTAMQAQNDQNAALNALLSDPNATPEQLARGGRPDVANFLLNNQRTQSADRNQSLTQLSQVASQVIGLDPVSRRNAVASILQAPQFRPAFDALGFDPSAINLDALDDGSLESELRQLAALGGGTQGAGTAELQTFAGMTQGMSTEDIMRARRIALGLEGRAGQGKVTMVGNVPHWTYQDDSGQPVSIPLSTIEQEASGAATVAGAEAGAKAGAAADAQVAQDAAANSRTLEVWQIARDSLMEALSNTETGPIAGRIPAVTAAQQTAEGAIAAVAPVLKQLFRSAGEGIFTDRDQELLLDMVPKRTDEPEARQSKIEMIDAIVNAKLGSGASSGGKGALPDGVTEDDIAFTMQKHGLTREQVLQRIGNAP